MTEEFKLGTGKYKHRIAEDPDPQSNRRGPEKKLKKARPQCFILDQSTIDGITELGIAQNLNKSALIRTLVQKAQEEMAA